jgi:hypothetical protein
MPSHSKKQHNFMEAIAHSPSFAKKVGVPQSVGKDYAAADKGKTFGKGDNMKRMAFGGETASDKKAKTRLANMREEDAEVAEGRQKQQKEDRLERYRRNIAMDDLKIAQKQGKTYDKWFEDNRKAQLKEGILRQDAYDEGKGYEMLTPTQHRQALTSSGMKKGGEVKESKAMVGKEVAFMKKKGAPAKMIKHEMSEMKGMKAGGKVRRMAAGGTGDPFERDTDYEAEKAQGAKNLEGIKNFFGFGKKEEKEAPVPRPSLDPSLLRFPKTETAATPAASTSRVSSQSPRTRRNNEDTSTSDAVERDDAAAMDRTTKGPQYTSSIKTDEGEYSYPAFKPENRVSQDKEPTRPRKPTTVSKTRETTSVTAAPSKGKVPAKIDSEKLLRDAEEEVLRKKPTAMTEQMRKAPTTSELYAGQKSMGQEIGDALKSFRASIRSGNGKGFKDALAKQFDTPPFHLKERKENKGKFVIEHDEYAKGGKVKRMRYGGDTGMDMGQPMRGMAPTPAPRGRGMPMPEAPRNGRGLAQLRQATELPPERAPSPIERMPYQEPEGQMPKMPDGEMIPRSPIEPPPREPKLLPGQKPEELFGEINRRMYSGMMQPSRPGEGPRIDGPGIKAGGQVKKMAQGGYAKADGAASRGKTQPKMVKMAKGGFVKTADGCAQRGKTKAFQVKMKRGGMC